MFILASNDPKIDISTHQNHKIPIPEIMGILHGYRVIPEGGFLRVLGIRYLPVPEPKSSGIGYGCELGYTTLLATHVTLLVAGWGFRILGCPRQKPVQRALRSFYALILDPAYFCILFPLAIKYGGSSDAIFCTRSFFSSHNSQIGNPS